MLRIIHIVPPDIEFPPIRYGGTERVAYYLLNAQVSRYRVLQKVLNEDIIFEIFAKINKTFMQQLEDNISKYSIMLNLYTCPETSYYDYILCAIRKILKSQKEGREKIVIHNHVIQRDSFILLHLSSLGKNAITTLHYDPPFYKFSNFISLFLKGKLIAISKNQYDRLKRFLGSALYGYVHNGIPVDKFPFCKDKGDYFISINAIAPAKGVHNAIILSRKLKTKLILIGPIRDYKYFEILRKYFDKYVTYLGEVDEGTKRKLLCKARALLFPVEREEYFGLNMVEAMACGTPVIAFSRGAVPEIVQHGITGFIGFSVEELMKYVQQLDKLDPKVIREYTKGKFSSEGMALKYALIYKSMLKS